DRGAAAAREPAADVEQNRRLSDFDALPMEGVGHFPMLEQPAVFLALLEHWIEELSVSHETAPEVSPKASRATISEPTAR
ncbi:MAG: hypothetical protein HOP15_08920, partial [Planctomycetes bacterium]|nr:hypothetical protein [Planctomycetota bacterium]